MPAKLPSDRALLVGLYVGGVAYAFLSLSHRGFTSVPDLIALLIELILLIGSFMPSSLNKKELGALGLIIIVYLLLSLLLGALLTSLDTVVMAASGIAIFSFIMSNPKFPLTRRAMATGVVVGIVFTFLGIYLTLKVGVMLAIGAELLGFLILSTQGRYTPEENTIVVAIANGSAMITVGVLNIFPAIAIFVPKIDPVNGPAYVNQLITIPFIAFMILMTGVFGFVILIPFRDRFDNAPWPQVAPQAETIKSMAAESHVRKPILMGLAASGAWTAAREIGSIATGNSMDTFPHAVVPAFPDWIGISNSPLMASIGFFMGWKRVIVIFIGSLTSVLLWVVLEAADFTLMFSDHLHRPEVLYLALGVFASVLLGDFLKREVSEGEAEIEPEDRPDQEPEEMPERRISIRWMQIAFVDFKEEVMEMVDNPREYLRSRRGQLPVWVAIVSMIIFMGVGLIFFSFFTPFPGIQIDWLLFIIGSPLALVSAYFTAVAVSETGMLAGFISDIVAVPAIVVFRVTFQVISTFMALLSGLQNAALAALVHLKLGQATNVRGRDIIKAIVIGIFLATTIGSLITFMIFVTYGFGGSDFPSPTAQLFGFLVVSLSGLTEFKLPGMGDGLVIPIIGEIVFPINFIYLISLGVVGGLAGRHLLRRGLSPISLAVGLLIPPATSVAMLVGGFLHYRFKKREELVPKADRLSLQTVRNDQRKTGRILSGAVSGEAIVTVIFVLWNAILFFAP